MTELRRLRLENSAYRNVVLSCFTFFEDCYANGYSHANAMQRHGECDRVMADPSGWAEDEIRQSENSMLEEHDRAERLARELGEMRERWLRAMWFANDVAHYSANYLSAEQLFARLDEFAKHPDWAAFLDAVDAEAESQPLTNPDESGTVEVSTKE